MATQMFVCVVWNYNNFTRSFSLFTLRYKFLREAICMHAFTKQKMSTFNQFVYDVGHITSCLCLWFDFFDRNFLTECFLSVPQHILYYYLALIKVMLHSYCHFSVYFFRILIWLFVPFSTIFFLCQFFYFVSKPGFCAFSTVSIDPSYANPAFPLLVFFLRLFLHIRHGYVTQWILMSCHSVAQFVWYNSTYRRSNPPVQFRGGPNERKT